ncbi:hypothetical protein SteCoe_33579 [Stentor coeruleus]|uniref:Mei2-like C-terminal RNA recognition motif domain-containing protein n=1 Tax=Stentor coeruleus TaxID=5963 RepID=A0A1R2AWD1_9CILI|nr:hypothetical protein SteCoe_33579 [Stentor coeruleus]
MDTLKQRRLQVFKNITRDLTPEALEKLLDPISHSKGQSPNLNHLSYHQSYDPLKSYATSNQHTNHYLQNPKSNTTHSTQCVISAYKPNEMHTIIYSKKSIKENYPPIKGQILEKPHDLVEKISFESSSDYFSVFSNSPMLSISTQESSREEFEEKRKPRKRPLEPSEKDFYVIKIQAIKLNQDLRTTVMIKNIPNKYTQKMLLQAIDKKFGGTYDFLYLPIDFKNRCNVGYAFINFVDFRVIPMFYQEFNMKKWERFNSEKICELAYGRIQGLKGLVQHFQNSSVINQIDSKVKPVILGKY